MRDAAQDVGHFWGEDSEIVLRYPSYLVVDKSRPPAAVLLVDDGEEIILLEWDRACSVGFIVKHTECCEH
jgi:hypothetical protein